MTELWSAFIVTRYPTHCRRNQTCHSKKQIELSRHAEARKHNREYVRENTAATNKTVDYVKPAHAINKHNAGAKPKAKNYPTADPCTTTRTHSCNICKWCGRSRHDRRHCPAREAICRNCQRKGHFHSVCRGEKVLHRVNEVQQLGSFDLPYLGYIEAKCDNKHIFVEIDVPYSGHNGENCADEKISPQIDVPYSGHNGGNCANEHIFAEIDVPYSGENGENCADEQISAEIDVPFLGYVGAKCYNTSTPRATCTGQGDSVGKNRETTEASGLVE